MSVANMVKICSPPPFFEWRWNVNIGAPVPPNCSWLGVRMPHILSSMMLSASSLRQKPSGISSSLLNFIVTNQNPFKFHWIFPLVRYKSSFFSGCKDLNRSNTLKIMPIMMQKNKHNAEYLYFLWNWNELMHLWLQTAAIWEKIIKSKEIEVARRLKVQKWSWSSFVEGSLSSHC